jgi:hypothetical protein
MMRITHTAFMALVGVSAIALDFAQIGPGTEPLRGMSGRMGTAMQRDAALPADMQLVREMVTKHDQSNAW